jgi:DHA1 family multidrug resistance protein-like MFS transporter
VLLGGLLLTLPVVLAMARVHSAGVFVLCCGGLGLTLAVVWPAMYAAVGLRFAPAFQGRLLALVSAGQLAGTIAGFGLGAVLIDHVSYSATFAAALILVAAGALLTALLTTDPRRARRGASGRDGLPQPGAFRALGDPAVALLITLILILSAGLALLQPDLKPYSERVLHVSFSTFGLLLVPPGLVGATLLMPAGYLADRVGRVPPMVGGLLVFGLCVILLPQTRAPAVASAIASVAVAGYVVSLPALSASLLDVSNDGNRGLLTGLTTSIQAIGIVVGPLIGGAAVDGFGPLAPFRLSAAMIAVAVALALLYGLRLRVVAPSSPRPAATGLTASRESRGG